MKLKCPVCGGRPVQIQRVLGHYELKCSYCWWHDTIPIQRRTKPVAAEPVAA